MIWWFLGPLLYLLGAAVFFRIGYVYADSHYDNEFRDTPLLGLAATFWLFAAPIMGFAWLWKKTLMGPTPREKREREERRKALEHRKYQEALQVLKNAEWDN